MATASAMEVRRIKCLFCESTFRDNFNVKRHINSKHPEMSNEILKINCALCGLIYIRSREETPTVEMCQECRKRSDIAPPELYNFSSEEEFQKWKQKLELDTSTRYVKSRKTSNLENGSVKSEFPCYLSTFLSPKNKRINPGSNKKPITCPAKIICEFTPRGSVSVQFFSEHKGHNLDANQMFMKEVKPERVQMEAPPPPPPPLVPVGSSPSFNVHINNYAVQNSDSLSNFNNFNLEDTFSNDYNNDLDLVLSQIENDGQMTSGNKVWLPSFYSSVQSLGSNKSNTFSFRPSKPSPKKVLSVVPEPQQMPIEAQTSNRMTEEERQSIIQMVLDDL